MSIPNPFPSIRQSNLAQFFATRKAWALPWNVGAAGLLYAANSHFDLSIAAPLLGVVLFGAVVNGIISTHADVLYDRRSNA